MAAEIVPVTDAAAVCAAEAAEPQLDAAKLHCYQVALELHTQCSVLVSVVNRVVRDQLELNRFEHGGRDFLDVFFVLGRDQNSFDPRSMRRQNFLFQTADRQNGAAQRDLAGHRQVIVHRDLH